MTHPTAIARSVHHAPKAQTHGHVQGERPTPSASHSSADLAAKAHQRGLIATPHKTHSTAVLHGRKPPAVKGHSVDDLICGESKKRDKINQKTHNGQKGFDFEKDGGMEGLKAGYPKLVQVTHRVASLTKVPFHYLIASLYAESNLRTNAASGDAKGIAQSKRIAWNELKKSDEDYSEFRRLWSELSPGAKLPSGPGRSPSADILFMAVWTIKREQKCPLVASLDGSQKEKARRLCYCLQGKANEFIKTLSQTGDVFFSTDDMKKNWRNFKLVLDAATPAMTISK